MAKPVVAGWKGGGGRIYNFRWFAFFFSFSARANDYPIASGVQAFFGNIRFTGGQIAGWLISITKGRDRNDDADKCQGHGMQNWPMKVKLYKKKFPDSSATLLPSGPLHFPGQQQQRQALSLLNIAAAGPKPHQAQAQEFNKSVVSLS